nr:GNAT family N-acetyltransferase [Maliibacterium massiliense]
MGKTTIVPAQEAYITSYWHTLDAVAREKKFLGMAQAFPLEETYAFMQDCIARQYPCYFVLNREQQVVGWIDIRARDEAHPLVGYLGMGLRQQYRGQGLGRKLLEVALRRAQAFGFTRVELDVRVPNIRAINLYMQVGFRPVGTIKNGVTIDGVSEDVLQMRLDFPSGRMMD